MSIPGNMVAMIIGKCGEVIKSIEKETGTILSIIQDTPALAIEKQLKIAGKPDAVNAAKKRVEKILGDFGYIHPFKQAKE